MAEFNKNEPYSEESIRAKRKIPKRNIIIMVILVAIQLTAILLAAFYEPKPLDSIEEYNVTVTPQLDGTLNIKYDILWRALSKSEPLEWVEIGLANSYFTLIPDSVSNNVEEAIPLYDDDYPYMQLDFKRSYSDGETVRFSFEINQREMLCLDGDNYLYDFVPGWFNEISVEHYCFSWFDNGVATDYTEGAERIGDYLVWEGSLDRGEYKQIRVNYDRTSFYDDVHAVRHQRFNSSGAYDALDDSFGIWAIVILVVIFILIFEVYLLDSFVSYGRGRGFLMGYGHPIHVYGYGNPHYRRAANEDAKRRNTGLHGRGGRSGGGGSCACACACACAGGGRAGCSRKAPIPQIRENEE